MTQTLVSNKPVVLSGNVDNCELAISLEGCHKEFSTVFASMIGVLPLEPNLGLEILSVSR